MGNECCALRLSESKSSESVPSTMIKLEAERVSDDGREEVKAVNMDIVSLLSTYQRAKEQGAISLAEVESNNLGPAIHYSFDRQRASEVKN